MHSNGSSGGRLCLYPDPSDEVPPHLAGARHSGSQPPGESSQQRRGHTQPVMPPAAVHTAEHLHPAWSPLPAPGSSNEANAAAGSPSQHFHRVAEGKRLSWHLCARPGLARRDRRPVRVQRSCGGTRVGTGSDSTSATRRASSRTATGCWKSSRSCVAACRPSSRRARLPLKSVPSIVFCRWRSRVSAPHDASPATMLHAWFECGAALGPLPEL